MLNQSSLRLAQTVWGHAMAGFPAQGSATQVRHMDCRGFSNNKSFKRTVKDIASIGIIGGYRSYNSGRYWFRRLTQRYTRK